MTDDRAEQRAPTLPAAGGSNDRENDRVADKKLSDETRMALAVAELEKRLFNLPIKIAFGALATLAGRLIAASHRDEDKRRNNRHVFVHTVDGVLLLEEARQEKEARIKAKIEQTAAAQQAAEPLRNINLKEIELAVRSQFRADDA
jgi:hypothetical protein